MNNSELITSTQNPRIKALLQLQEKSSQRRKQQEFVLEGRREIMHAIERGYKVHQLYAIENWKQELETDEFRHLKQMLEDVSMALVSRNVYERIAYRDSTEGMVAVMGMKDHSLNSLNPFATSNRGVHSPLYVVLESVEKPGNLGAILRSADAAGVDAVIVCDALTDLYNPNLIRASLGGIFSVSTVSCTSSECIEFLKSHGVRILTAQLQDSKLYYDTDMTLPTAIVMGTEATGLTEQWREAADAHIRIPMLGILDSLNVSVSAAILMFEAVRQRGV